MGTVFSLLEFIKWFYKSIDLFGSAWEVTECIQIVLFCGLGDDRFKKVWVSRCRIQNKMSGWHRSRFYADFNFKFLRSINLCCENKNMLTYYAIQYTCASMDRPHLKFHICEIISIPPIIKLPTATPTPIHDSSHLENWLIF